jgi:hypothetical protein
MIFQINTGQLGVDIKSDAAGISVLAYVISIQYWSILVSEQCVLSDGRKHHMSVLKRRVALL